MKSRPTLEMNRVAKDPRKPKGKMSAYAYFVQTCREEHKKKSPEIPVNFAEFSKKCSGRWKVRWNKTNNPLKPLFIYIFFGGGGVVFNIYLEGLILASAENI